MKKKTTIAISCKHDDLLAQLIEKNDTNKKHFLEKSIEYFGKYDINPLEEFKPPKDELTKVVKKLDQVIAFIRVQERDILKPACVSVIQSSKSIEASLKSQNDVATTKSVQDSIRALSKWIDAKLQEMKKESSQHDTKLVEALMLLAQQYEKDKGKNIQEYLQNIFKPK